MREIHDTASVLGAGREVFSQWRGFGVPVESIPTTGDNGGSFINQCYTLPGDAGHELRFRIESGPGEGTLEYAEDGVFEFTAPVSLTTTAVARLWDDGADLGTFTLTFEAGHPMGASGGADASGGAVLGGVAAALAADGGAVAGGDAALSMAGDADALAATGGAVADGSADLSVAGGADALAASGGALADGAADLSVQPGAPDLAASGGAVADGGASLSTGAALSAAGGAAAGGAAALSVGPISSESDTAEVVAAIVAHMAAAMPARIVTDSWMEPSNRLQGELEAGVLTVIAQGEGDYSDIVGREAQMGELDMILVAQLSLPGAPSVETRGKLIAAAEMAFSKEIKQWAQGLSGWPQGVVDVRLRSMKFSGQTEAPKGWVVAMLRVALD